VNNYQNNDFVFQNLGARFEAKVLIVGKIWNLA
jgi:hypothetical protein